MIESKDLESSYRFELCDLPKFKKVGNKILELSSTFIGKDH